MHNIQTSIADPGEEYWALFETLSNDLVELHVDWDQYRKLFGANSRRVELLNMCAAGFFARIQWTMLSHTAIAISRLLDPPGMGRRTNLVLASVAQGLEDPSQARLRGELEQKLEGLRQLAAPVVALRHKHLAHRDREHALGDATLAGVSREQIESILDGIRDLMNHAQQAIRGSATVWEYSSLPADGDSLIMSLRKAVAYSDMMTEGKIDRAEITRLPYGDV